MKTPKTPGEALNAARTNNGAILDIDTKAKDYDAIVKTLASQWREWVDNKSGGAFKLSARSGGGETIDKTLRNWPFKRMEVVLLTSKLKGDKWFKLLETMAPFWKFESIEVDGYRFSLKELAR